MQEKSVSKISETDVFQMKEEQFKKNVKTNVRKAAFKHHLHFKDS